MKKFKTGNIVKLPTGDTIIIVGYRTINTTNESYDVCDWVSYTASNVAGCTRTETHSNESMCWECDINDGGRPDESCECCEGTGYYTETIEGMDRATYLGDNARDYVIGKLGL